MSVSGEGDTAARLDTGKEDEEMVVDKDDPAKTKPAVNGGDGARRNSPRKAALEARTAAAVQDVSDIEEIDDDEDAQSDSSDSIMEVDAEDPLAVPPNPKPVSAPKIVTLDNLKAIQEIARQRKQEENVTLVDTSKILAGRSVTITPYTRPTPVVGGGVTITRKITPGNATSTFSPVVPRQGPVLTPHTTLSRVSNLPSSAHSSHSSPVVQAGPTTPAMQADPNLTDDMFVLEAPSFVVPYVYEKAPHETFRDFKKSVKKLAKEQKEKRKKKSEEKEQKSKKEQEKSENGDESKDKESKTGEETEEKAIDNEEKIDEEKNEKDSEIEEEQKGSETKERKGEEKIEARDKTEEKDEENMEKTNVKTEEKDEESEGKKKKTDAEKESDKDEVEIVSTDDESDASDDSDDIEEVDVKKSENFFESSIGKFLIDLGMNLVQEHVQEGLLKDLQKKSQRDKSSQMMRSIMALKNNLETSQKKNESFHYELIKCHRCLFQTESELVLCEHQREIHMKHGFSRCSMCRFDSMQPHEVFAHMKNVHGINPKVEPKRGMFECPQCESNISSKAQFTKHKLACDKRFVQERNQAPPFDWETPCKLPKPLHLSRNITRSNPHTFNGNSLRPAGFSAHRVNLPFGQVQRQGVLPMGAGVVNRPAHSALLGNRLHSTNLISNLSSNPSLTVQSVSQRTGNGVSLLKSNQSGQQPSARPGLAKSGLVICEICDGYISDLGQFKNHMSMFHKIKIHPKMVHQRPPLNCQKCHARYFTDQGLERHLLGSHGLVTASMQDLATSGQDAGRCPICGKVFRNKLVSHVSKDHGKPLKPAHLSYKCTVCDATFAQYKLFENHVYEKHSAASKNAEAEKSRAGSSTNSEKTSTESTEKSTAVSTNNENVDDDVIELDDDDTKDSLKSEGADTSGDEPVSKKSKLENSEEVQELSDDD